MSERMRLEFLCEVALARDMVLAVIFVLLLSSLVM